MGKARRTRGQREQPTTGASAATVFPNFPYEKKFTREEIRDITDRAKLVGDAMRDGVAPSGHTLFIPGDMFEMWMIHAALAGVTVDESLAYIRAKPAKDSPFEDAVEWVLKRDDTPEALEAEAEAAADAYLRRFEESQRELRPEVRDVIRRRMKAAAEAGREWVADDPDAEHRIDTPKDFGPPRLARPDETETTP